MRERGAFEFKAGAACLKWCSSLIKCCVSLETRADTRSGSPSVNARTHPSEDGRAGTGCEWAAGESDYGRWEVSGRRIKGSKSSSHKLVTYGWSIKRFIADEFCGVHSGLIFTLCRSLHNKRCLLGGENYRRAALAVD